jgi:hypothetical protein
VRATAAATSGMLRSIGVTSATAISAEATAVRDVQPSGAPCFTALDPAADGGLRVNGNARIDGGRCEVHVHSAHNNSAFIFNSNTRFDAARFCVRGGVINRGQTTGRIESPCNPNPDPYAGALPRPTVGACTFSNLVFNPQPGPIRLTPGTYCGNTIFNGNATVELDPGVYVIKDGPMILNGGSTLRGTGVTFYFTGNASRIQMNGNMRIELAAPTSGTYAGILMQHDPAMPRQTFEFNGNNGQELSGIIHMPNYDFDFKSSSLAGRSDRISVVARTVILNAQTDWRITPTAGGLAQASGPPRLIR